MHQIFLATTNNFVDSLYEMNLMAYVGYEPTRCTSFSNVFEKSSNISSKKQLIVVSLSVIENLDELIFRLDSCPSLYTLIIGKTNFEHDRALVVQNKYDIREIIRCSAKLLDVTARDMALKKVPDFYPIPKVIFSKLNESESDIFKKENDEYIRIYKKEDEYSYQKDIFATMEEHLYIESKKRLSFINQTSKLIVHELKDKSLKVDEVLKIADEGMNVVANSILKNDKISKEISQISKLCIDAISDIAKSVSKAKKLLEQLLNNQGGYIFNHTVLTTYLAKQIIKNMPWGTKEQEDKVAFAIYFHDIYLVPIFNKYDEVDEETLLFRSDVFEEEKETVFDHAALAGELVRTFDRAPLGVDTLITQHHGDLHGKGFPDFFNDEVSPLSKIILIAEELSKHILENVKENNLSLAYDKSLIKKKLLERFTRHTYKKIIEQVDKILL
ncbi:MAG: HD domain-containing protein [Bacteriovoracaceae bacterium]|jgi:HD-GYP domain-containing protein (c-di-GMP phosphodiesterase class II)|nr:HD domain-containing protein [Bacteriovoracaceae bacterium]